MFDKSQFTQIGYIHRSHGLVGELSCRISIDLNQFVEYHNKVYLFVDIDDCLIPFRVSGCRVGSRDSVLVTFVNLTTKDEADTLVEKSLWIENGILDKFLTDDQSLLDDFSFLIGFTVLNTKDGKSIGTIIDIDQSTINTLAHVANSNGDDYLIPIVEELIIHIDIETKIITIDIPEGLIE